MDNRLFELLESILDSLDTNRPSKSIMSVHDLSRYTGYSISHIYKLTSQRVLPYYKPQGKTIFFKKSEIDEFLLTNHRPSIDSLLQEALRPLNKIKTKK